MWIHTTQDATALQQDGTPRHDDTRHDGSKAQWHSRCDGMKARRHSFKVWGARHTTVQDTTNTPRRDGTTRCDTSARHPHAIMRWSTVVTREPQSVANGSVPYEKSTPEYFKFLSMIIPSKWNLNKSQAHRSTRSFIIPCLNWLFRVCLHPYSPQLQDHHKPRDHTLATPSALLLTDVLWSLD